jgi:DNA mismatch endonuclease (patch repair protein)
VADTLTVKERSERMARVHSHGNHSTELRLMLLFRTHGIVGWRRHIPLIGNPDFVFRKARVAVFVDGCFWHGCPRHARVPKSRVDFWLTKLAKNAERDRVVSRMLRSKGWKVIRIWECELSQATAWRAVAKIVRAIP